MEVCCTQHFAEATGWEYNLESDVRGAAFGHAQEVLFVVMGNLEAVFERGPGLE